MKNTDPNIIDYNLLHKAIKFFGKQGFTQIETPWRVSKEAIEVTFNSQDSFSSNDKFLVGSAEQGFLELKLQNKLLNNQYMSVSPCFRNEKEDYFHQQEFVKLELIYFSKFCVTPECVEFNFFRQQVIKFLTKELDFKQKNIIISITNDSSSIYSEDILINGIEYGSYGIRKFKDEYYIYGTGIALPRTSKIYHSLLK